MRLERDRYIGGHAVAAILGLHPHTTAGDVYAALALGSNEDISDKPAVKRGRIIEPALLTYVEDEQGRELKRDWFVLDDGIPFFGGTVDGADDTGLVEVTTFNSNSRHLWGANGTADAATHKWIQSQWYMGITGKQRADVVALCVDTDELLHYPCPAIEDAIVEMREAAEMFWWDHIIAKKPPDPTQWGKAHLDGMTHMLDAIYSKEEADKVDPTPELIEAARQYKAAHEALKVWESEKKSAANRIKANLADAGRSQWDGGRVQWTSHKLKAATDWQAVAETMQDELGIDLGTYQEIVQRRTKERFAKRTLRVYLTKKKESDDDGTTDSGRDDEAQRPEGSL